MGRLRYKGYTGSVEFSEEDNCFFGMVLGLNRTGIIYEGTSVESLKKDFEESIDFYLRDCIEDGVEPETPYSGKLVLRMTSEMHREAAEKAEKLGVSLNKFIKQAISAAL